MYHRLALLLVLLACPVAHAALEIGEDDIGGGVGDGAREENQEES